MSRWKASPHKTTGVSDEAVSPKINEMLKKHKLTFLFKKKHLQIGKNVKKDIEILIFPKLQKIM